MLICNHQVACEGLVKVSKHLGVSPANLLKFKRKFVYQKR